MQERRATSLCSLERAARPQGWLVLYAHTAAGKAVGLDQADIDAIIAGGVTEGLSGEERLARKMTLRLLAEHQVDQALQAWAVAAFGEKGLMDLLFLIGGYLTTCLLLNTFAVPVPNAGPARM